MYILAKYEITAKINREVEAENEKKAKERFWQELRYIEETGTDLATLTEYDIEVLDK